jgi:hypothetical protein
MYLPKPQQTIHHLPQHFTKVRNGSNAHPRSTEQVISTFSHKFNKAQLKYTVGEQELRATHEACRFFHDIIYGCNILIRCDHKNITSVDTKHLNLRILRQRLTLDQDYGAKFEHIAGELNTGADGLSRLQMTDNIPTNLVSKIYAIDELDSNRNFDFPLAMSLIKREQDKDIKIQETLQKQASNDRFGTMTFSNTLVHTIDGKIIIPESLQKCIINWYHSNLQHPRITRTINSISQTFYWKGIRPQVEEHIKMCNEGQCHKIVDKHHYGILPLIPALRDKKHFEKIQLDCAGPWSV